MFPGQPSRPKLYFPPEISLDGGHSKVVERCTGGLECRHGAAADGPDIPALELGGTVE
jgi:hypothetical protein